MSLLNQTTRSHSAKRHKSALRKKLRKIFLSAIFVSATVTASSAWAGPFRNRCNTCEPCDSCGPYASQFIDKNGDGVPDGPAALTVDTNGDGIADAPATYDGTRVEDYASEATDLASSPLDLAPNMIGDTTAGGCGGLFVGGVLAASVAHPTFACSRLNIAENNSPLIRDRVYYAYRHFHNASDVDLFSYSPQGGINALDIDRHLLGFEKIISPTTSLEFRLPINSQLNSRIHFQQIEGVSNLNQALTNTDTSIGNIDLILKSQLMTTNTFCSTIGLGLNLLTAPDLYVTGNVSDTNFDLYDSRQTLAENIISGPLGTANVQLQFEGLYRNRTVNLSPFAAFVWVPNETWFSQGFMQVDVPLNASPGSVTVAAEINNGDFVYPQETLSAKLTQQTLLRLNAGVGRWLYRSSEGRLNSLGLMFEAHYTTTLNDSDIESFRFAEANEIPGVDQPLDLGFGNLANRVDILNLVLGVPMQFGQTTVYNGFVAPIHERNGKGFDFEYMLSVNRRF